MFNTSNSTTADFKCLFPEVGMAQQHQNVIGVMVQYKLRQLPRWIISLLLGKISVIIVIDVQDNYTSQANLKMLIFI